MTTIAVRLPEEIVHELDRLVADGVYATRTEAVKRALADLIAARQREEIDRQIIEAYTRIPETEEELEMARRATIAMIEEEPW